MPIPMTETTMLNLSPYIKGHATDLNLVVTFKQNKVHDTQPSQQSFVLWVKNVRSGWHPMTNEN